MIKYISFCNGCPDCIGCGLKQKIPVEFCDFCRDNEALFEDENGNMYCPDCYENRKNERKGEDEE